MPIKDRLIIASFSLAVIMFMLVAILTKNNAKRKILFKLTWSIMLSIYLIMVYFTLPIFFVDVSQATKIIIRLVATIIIGLLLFRLFERIKGLAGDAINKPIKMTALLTEVKITYYPDGEHKYELVLDLDGEEKILRIDLGEMDKLSKQINLDDNFLGKDKKEYYEDKIKVEYEVEISYYPYAKILDYINIL